MGKQGKHRENVCCWREYIHVKDPRYSRLMGIGKSFPGSGSGNWQSFPLELSPLQPRQLSLPLLYTLSVLWLWVVVWWIGRLVGCGSLTSRVGVTCLTPAFLDEHLLFLHSLTAKVRPPELRLDEVLMELPWARWAKGLSTECPKQVLWNAVLPGDSSMSIR